jgi:hypothetical protein
MLLGYQNKLFFQEKNAFSLDLYLTEPYTTPELYNGVTFLSCFLVGLVIAFLFALLGSMRTRKTIKQLNKDLEDQRSQIDALNTELNAFKSASPPYAENSVAGADETAETEATKVIG